MRLNGVIVTTELRLAKRAYENAATKREGLRQSLSSLIEPNVELLKIERIAPEGEGN